MATDFEEASNVKLVATSAAFAVYLNPINPRKSV